MASTLSVVIATRNCEDRMASTIQPWRELASEILVVDQYSSDRTADIAREQGAQVFQNHPINENFDINRKIGMQRAKSDWILYIDTDERPTQELISELKDFLSNPTKQIGVEGIRIPNLFYFLGKPLRYGLYNKNSAEIRIFRKDVWKYNPEDGFHRGVSVQGNVIQLQSFYKHFNVNSLSEWFIKTNQYTELDSFKLAEDKNYKTGLIKAIFNSFRFFIKHYVFKLGFLDGSHGFVSIYYFMNYHFTLKMKVWEKRFLKQQTIEKDYLNSLQIPKR